MKPVDFIMGIRDFFSRFVPGAVFLFLFPPANTLIADEDSGLVLLAFAIAAYLAGSVAAGAGGLLDTLTDALLRNRAFRGAFAPNLARREALAISLRDQLLTTRLGVPAGSKDAESVKSFWWDHLRLNCPAAIAELDRIEAAQKLFRSLIAVFAFLGVYGAFRTVSLAGQPIPPAALFAMAVASVPFYVGGRLVFRGAVCRLAAAYSLTAAKPD
jgi:hypothetical protein